MNLDEIRRIRDEADCLADAAAVEAALERLAQEITAAVGDANPIVFVVMNGGVIFSGRLLPRLPFPLETSYLHATRYGDRTRGERLHWRAEPAQAVAGRTVLVLDDILDEGHTLDAIVNHLDEHGAEQVFTAVLVDKNHDRKAHPGMRAHFTGLDVADRFLFGCGMDYKGYWRNAPGIYAVRGL
ncbi:MAG: hypoxanthine-guanine phosphoribosyltransferase [Azoarcus sp.]|nr:hypoxanthine-guanine phosphoribosyltransferase [Azoarcus sp.]